MATLGADRFRFVTVALADTPPPNGDSAYIFASTRDNEDSPLPIAARLHTGHRVPRLLCSGNGPYRAATDKPISYPGFGNWMLKLTDFGVPRDAIDGLLMPPLWHTAVESREYILHEKGRGSTVLFSVAAPFQLPRAFANNVSQAIRSNFKVRIYAIRGNVWPGFWAQDALHSQGDVHAPRIDLLEGELLRLRKHVGPREIDLLPHKKLVDYLRWRDGMIQSFPSP